VIRLGSLAGYAFEGPRVLAGWTPTPAPAVFVIMYRPAPEARPQDHAVLYVGHSDDLSAEGFPFRHPRAGCWVRRAGSKWAVHIATLEVPGGTRAHREQIVAELCAVYDPACNTEKFDQAWESHWIQDYEAPNTTGPLTTPRQATPGQSPGS
jgi:hypothetical protein